MFLDLRSLLETRYLFLLRVLEVLGEACELRTSNLETRFVCGIDLGSRRASPARARRAQGRPRARAPGARPRARAPGRAGRGRALALGRVCGGLPRDSRLSLSDRRVRGGRWVLYIYIGVSPHAYPVSPPCGTREVRPEAQSLNHRLTCRCSGRRR